MFLSHAPQTWGGPACEGCAQERELPGAGSSLAGVCARLPRRVTDLSDATCCLASGWGPWAPGGTRGRSWVAAGTVLWGQLGSPGQGSWGEASDKGAGRPQAGGFGPVSSQVGGPSQPWLKQK